MDEIQIARLALMMVGGLGVILVLLGVTFNIIVKRQNKLCTKKTDGIIVKAEPFCPEIAGLFCHIAGLFCHSSRTNLPLKPACFDIAIS